MQESERKVVLMFLWQNPSRYSESELGNDDVILPEISVLNRDLIAKLILTHNSFFRRGHWTRQICVLQS